MNTEHQEQELYDAAVVGAGPSGLAAALTLSRSLLSVAVLDGNASYRNRDSEGIGGLLGRDTVMPEDLRGLGRQEIEQYGCAHFTDIAVQSLSRDATGTFKIVAEDDTVIHSKTVLLSCGMVDIFPNLPGIESFWGSSIINCPFCHGFELRNRPWGVFANRPEMLAAAEIYRMWSEDLTFFIEPGQEPSQARQSELERLGLRLERRPIHRLVGDDTGLKSVALEDGDHVACEAMVLLPHQRHTDLVASLNLAQTEDGSISVDEGYRTAVPGLYAAGDLLYQGHQNVNTALHMGNLAAVSIVVDLAQQKAARDRGVGAAPQ